MPMKRKFVLSITLLVLLLSLICLCSCNKKPQANPSDNVSRETTQYYAGESENFAVTVEKGRRERVFIADGVVTDVIDFAI